MKKKEKKEKKGKEPESEEVVDKILYVDINPHGGSKVISPKELDKPNILERAAYTEARILNSTADQLYNKALFNVVRALKKGSKCVVYLKTKEEAARVAEEGKIAGFLTADILETKVTLQK